MTVLSDIKAVVNVEPVNFIDITGWRSGLLVAKEYVGDSKWRCECDCGKTIVVRGDHIRKQEQKSCGCISGGKFIDIAGEVIDDLLIIERDTSKQNKVYWICKCLKCGNTLSVHGFNLRHHIGQHCPCSQIVLSGEDNLNFKHGGSQTRLYKIWQGMLNRCRNPNVKRYDCYGGRGITVCAEWETFEPFRNWALANGYDDSLSIDRIDVNGNYEPHNCRWITMLEQAKNRRPRKRGKI